VIEDVLPVDVRVTHVDRHAVVQVVGELDFATVDLLSGALDEACATGADVQLDMSGVSFIDASTLGVLVRYRRKLADAGCDIEIVRPSHTVVRLLRLTGLVDFVAEEPMEGAGGD
jgi:anti-sigma B factor antagonist